MIYTPFYQHFPVLANTETRSITIFSNNNFDLPADEYGLAELYCETPNCDCRRVMLTVVSRKSNNQVATLNFGWESRQFYEKWLSMKDKSMIDELKGPSLNSMSPQSKHAPNILTMVIATALKDEKYVERLKQHYLLFKNKTNSKKR